MERRDDKGKYMSFGAVHSVVYSLHLEKTTL